MHAREVGRPIYRTSGNSDNEILIYFDLRSNLQNKWNNNLIESAAISWKGANEFDTILRDKFSLTSSSTNSEYFFIKLALQFTHWAVGHAYIGLYELNVRRSDNINRADCLFILLIIAIVGIGAGRVIAVCHVQIQVHCRTVIIISHLSFFLHSSFV